MTKKGKSVKTNLLYNTIYQITVTILPLITTPYLSRVVAAKGIGIYSYYNSITTYFMYFGMLGISNYGNRSIAKTNSLEKRNEKFSSIYYLQIITSLIVILLYFLFCVLFIKENRTIGLIFSLQVISVIFDVSWLFFGLQEFKTTALRQIFVRLVAFFSIIIFVKSPGDLWKYVVIMCFSTFFSSFILWVMAWKKVKLVRISKRDIVKHFKPVLILFIPIIATSVYRVMDIIMLGSLRTMKEVGFYENSQKLITISLGIIASFGAVMMPKISNLLSNNKIDEARKMFDKSMEFALCIGMAIAFGISSVSKEFVPIFFGKEFIPSINYSMFLSITVPFITWAAIVRLLYLIPTEHDKIYVTSVIVGAVLNFVTNLLLMKSLGVYGAIIGTIIAEVSVATYQTIKVGKQIEFKKHLREALIFLLIGSVMFVFVRVCAFLLPSNVFGLLLEITFGGLIYILFSFLYFYYTKNDILLNVLKKKGLVK